MVTYWQSNDQSQVVTDWSSSGRGLTVKWCNIGSLIKTVQVVMDLVTDWSSSGMGSTVKWSHIGSLIKTVQVAMDWSSSGKGLTVKWCRIGVQVVWD